MTEQTDTIQRTRLYFTGDCDGFAELKESLAQHPALEVIGSSDQQPQDPLIPTTALLHFPPSPASELGTGPGLRPTGILPRPAE